MSTAFTLWLRAQNMPEPSSSDPPEVRQAYWDGIDLLKSAFAAGERVASKRDTRRDHLVQLAAGYVAGAPHDHTTSIADKCAEVLDKIEEGLADG